MTAYTRDQIRRLVAQEYARKATELGTDLEWLFDVALREGELTAFAAVVELGLARHDVSLVETVRAMCPEAREPKEAP